MPKYRGAGPIQWTLMNGDKNTGVTIFQIQSKVDTGDILCQKSIKIHKDDNMHTLGMRLCTIGAKLMLVVLNNFENGKIKRKCQSINNISFAPKITKEMLIINWSWAAEKIHNWIRALSPKPGMYTFFKGKKLRIFKTKIKKGMGKPGEIFILNKNSCIINTGKESLSILEVQLEGRKKMVISDFLSGVLFKKGEILG